jgi:hypothetical protein
LHANICFSLTSIAFAAAVIWWTVLSFDRDFPGEEKRALFELDTPAS